MKRVLVLLLGLTAAAPGDTIAPGAWQLTSRVVEASIPGVPGFVVNMVVKKPKVEEKCVAPNALDAGMSRLLAPNPVGKCTLERNEVAGGRFVQAMTCPHKMMGPLTIVRIGSYDADSYRARVTMTGSNPKRRAHLLVDMEAHSTGKACKK